MREDGPLRLPGTMRVNHLGHLEIGGCDTVELARQFGTPLYVLDEALIRRQCRKYREAFVRHGLRGEVIYAGKALLNKAVCRIIAQEGLSLDVVSGGELYTAIAAGFPPERIYFHGNNKSEEELRQGLDCGVHRFVVDSLYELHLLNNLAAEAGKVAGVYLRITPGVEAHTHTYIRTGQRDSKFGFDLVGSVALEATKQALALPHINLVGFHCHIGSQIFDVESFKVATEVMLDFAASVWRETGFALRELDLGGGMGIRHVASDRPLEPEQFVAALADAVRTGVRRHGLPEPKILIEPGRSIVGEAGTTLYTVGAIKDVPGIRTYVAVDGGMYENPRVALYQAEYTAVVANRVHAPADRVVSVAGKCCESGDMLIWDLRVPELQPGDVLAMLSTGAARTPWPATIRMPPATVLVREGQADLIVRRETYADLVRYDVLPERLAAPEHLADQRAIE